MNTNSERIYFLLEKYASNSCTKEELDELFTYIKNNDDKEELEYFLSEEWSAAHPAQHLPTIDWDKMYSNITASDKVVEMPRRRNTTWYAAAAIFVLLGTSIFLFLQRNADKNDQVAATNKTKSKYGNDALPGGDRAVLTLADGTEILLDSAADGLLAKQGNIEIVKLASGEITYKVKATDEVTAANTFNTISTPKGGQYKVLLPDGSKVWLNAATTFRFPAAFNNKERAIDLNGEAYFEIATVMSEGKKVPFIVNANEMKVEVLGTHFNVMAYDDENVINTTLLEGSVKVSNGKNTSLLKPGQQSVLNKQSNNMTVSTADLDKAVAWKNGMFIFKGDDLDYIMKQVARWYNLDLEYVGGQSLGHYTGSIGRNVNVSEVLRVLELSGVKFKIQGQKITIQP